MKSCDFIYARTEDQPLAEARVSPLKCSEMCVWGIMFILFYALKD